MSDALPLAARPNLDQYKKLAKDLQRACKSGDADAVRAWSRALRVTAAGRREFESRLGVRI
jgi:hypothetical protein